MLSQSHRKILLQGAVLLTASSLQTFVAAAAPRPVPGTSQQPARVLADVRVAGRVTQANGDGLPGVTVVVKGTSLGTSTDATGNFSLEVPEGSVLVFSFVGYSRREVPVTEASTSFNVTLSEDAQALKEVVVVGYGTQERQSVTGAVASVSGRDVAAQPVADAAQAIQGRAAGVQVVSNSGSPGVGGTSVRVRGITSAGNNSPLYVVDGFPLPSAVDGNGNATGNELNSINPNDIESIDVLKDASATAIYGVRAANGVVIITTKRGKAGVSGINLDAYVGTQRVWRQIPLLNAQEFAQLNNEARRNGGLDVIPKYANPGSLGAGTNWLDEIFRPAKIQNYALSATGGSEKARYAASAGYFQQDGTIVNSSFQRFTLRANGEVQLSKVLKIGNTLGLTHQEEQPLNNENNEFSGVIQLALQAPPTAPALNPNGTYYEFTSADNYGEENPITAARRPQIKNNRNRITSTFYAELEPLQGLRLRTNVGTDLQFLQGDQFFPSIVGSSKYPTSQAQASSNTSYSPSYLIENTLTYDKLIGSNHQLSLLAGQSAQQFDNFYLGGSRTGYSTNNLTILDRGPVNSQLSNNGGNSRTRLASYFGRANYEFAGKYLFQAILRYDGSSAFAPDNQFGFFPGASVGWRISEEDFLKDNTYVSNLKLRVGYGRVGNPLNAGTFSYLTTVNSTPQSNNGVPGTGYVFGTGSQLQVIGGAPTRLKNGDLRWENNEQINVGLDAGLWKNRLSGSIDLYRRTSPNLIAAVPVTYVSGTSENINTNAAAATNRGIDLALTSNNFVGEAGGLSWSTTLNLSAYRNEITSLGAGKPFDGQNTRGGGNLVRYEAGVPFGSFYGYVADGIFQTTEDVKNHAVQVAGTDPTKSTAPGDIRFRDLNKDGVINADDRTFIGDPNPNFTYGLNNTLGFKGFDLNIFLQGSQGNDVYNLNRYYTEGGLYGASNASTLTLDRWTGPGTSNDIPRAVAGDPNQNLRISSHYVEDGSYLRVKLLTLGYTLPADLGKKLYTQRVRIYVSSQNLLTLTKYEGFDPELGNQGGSFGVDRGVYPQARTFLAGINIGF